MSTMSQSVHYSARRPHISISSSFCRPRVVYRPTPGHMSGLYPLLSSCFHPPGDDRPPISLHFALDCKCVAVDPASNQGTLPQKRNSSVRFGETSLTSVHTSPRMATLKGPMTAHPLEVLESHTRVTHSSPSRCCNARGACASMTRHLPGTHHCCACS
jgi:hypothetical protein